MTLDRRSRQILRGIQRRFEDVFLVLSPPRCSSTAFARVFWEQPSIRWYLHEPFDVVYHRQAGLDHALRALDRPLEIRGQGNRLVIKEMTFQIGDHFPLLLELTTKPVLFLVRDPRLSIWSRMEMLRQGGQDPVYPERESGWRDLQEQIFACRARRVPYAIVDSSAWRNHPGAILPKLFQSLGLPFSLEMLRWTPRRHLQLGSLGQKQDGWYRRVLASSGVEREDEAPRAVGEFPHRFRPHLEECLRVYEGLMADERSISLVKNP